jgi:hypothetical protein
VLRFDYLLSLEKRLPLRDKAYNAITETLSPLGEYAKNLVGDHNIAERLRNTTLESYTFLTGEISLRANISAQRPQKRRREPRSAVATSFTPGTDSGVNRSMLGRDNGAAVTYTGVQLQNEYQNAVQNSAEALAYVHHGVNDPQQGGVTVLAGKEIATINQDQGGEPGSKSRLHYSTHITDGNRSCSLSPLAGI